MRVRQIILIILSSFLLVSCIPTQEIEELGVIHTRGVDISENGQYETTLVIFQFEKQSDNITKVVSGKSNTIKGAVKNANLETNLQLAPGKIELEVYGMDAAKSGIFPYLDTLSRDANLPDTTVLSISKNPAKDILTIQDKDVSKNIGQFLHGLIEEESKKGRYFPKVTIQDFLSKFYDTGIDPILPMFEFDGDHPKISSIAIMQDDKYVGERPADEILLFNLVKEKVRNKWLEVSIPMGPFEKHIEKETNIGKRKEILHTAFNIVNSRGTTRLVDKSNLQFETKIMLEVNLFEMSERVLLNNPKVVKLIEKEVENKLTAQYEEILEQLQEQNADPFGYGAIYRIHQKDGKLVRKDWREMYPTIKVDFKIKTKIIRHGTID
ncbi:Ger(x)C family spore germination protein [Bacillus niameyensis]|uniref:Ger(x)C family spore germination protein n=1 Tax=Bacillus niameyensis TaxID=1522308 RepID=UPI000782AAA0|nr:Ger(x)C family spore germination protein [Bacillus niameyensis]